MSNHTAGYSPEYLAESKAALLNTFYSIPIPLEILSTACRLWFKARLSALAFDDYFMIWATIVAVAECITGLVYGAPFGLGRHMATVSSEQLRMFLKGDYIFSHFYNSAICCTKLSVLALYWRIFETGRFRSLVLGTAVFVLAWLVSIEIALGFGCRPIQAWWGEVKGECVNKVKFTYFTNITNLVCDLWIFSMPIPILARLRAHRDKRFGLIFLFSIGLGTCAISAARLSFVFGVGSPDMTWWVASLGILSAWEPCGGILCANLPLVYRPLLKLIRRVKSTVVSSYSRGGARTDQSGRDENVVALNNQDWARQHPNRGGLLDTDVTFTQLSMDKPPEDELPETAPTMTAHKPQNNHSKAQLTQASTGHVGDSDSETKILS